LQHNYQPKYLVEYPLHSCPLTINYNSPSWHVKMVARKATELFLRRTIGRRCICIGISPSPSPSTSTSTSPQTQTTIATQRITRSATATLILSAPLRTFSNDLKNSKSDPLLENESPDNGYKHLLTRATARQLKGDVTEAIALSNKALDSLRFLQENQNHDSGLSQDSLKEEIADTLLFLGKLHQLQGSFAEAIDLFAESRAMYKEQQQQEKSGESPTNTRSKIETTPTFEKEARRKELVALSHLATARGRLRHIENASSRNADIVDTSSIEADFKEALEGLEKDWGWSDGMTNHTAHEWSLYCSRTMNDPKKAQAILSRMKENLSNIFGSDDRRVLQLNGEMAELWQRMSIAIEGTMDQKKNIDNSDITNVEGQPQSITTMESAGENAILLLEEALDKLPPNSPEARRLFMQLEELKEAQELQEQFASDATEPAMASTDVTVTYTPSAASIDSERST